jgi:DNA-binding NarL/FixJ family response regulator
MAPNQEPQRSVSVVVADDHPVVLRGITEILRAQPDISVVAACSCGRDATAAFQQFAPDVAVLDIVMPDLNGLDVLSIIERHGFKTRVVILTAVATEDRVLAAMTRGAKGLLFKDAAPDNLVDCVREVARGKLWFPEVFGALADDIDAPAGHSNPDQSACSSKPAGESPRAFVTMRLYPASQMMTCATRTTVAAMARDCTACIRISGAVVLRFGMGTLPPPEGQSSSPFQKRTRLRLGATETNNSLRAAKVFVACMQHSSNIGGYSTPSSRMLPSVIGVHRSMYVI